MLIINLFLFLCVIAAAGFARANPKGNPLVAGLTLLLILSLVFQFLKQGNTGIRAGYSTRWDEAVGFRLAKALSEDGINRGTVLIIDERGTEAENDLAESRFQGFQQGLSSGSLQLLRINAADLSTLKELDLENIPEEMTPQGPVVLSLPLLRETLNQYPDVAALVSFAGLPASMPDAALPGLPPLYVYGLEHHTTDHADEVLLRFPSFRAIVRKKAGAGLPVKPRGKTLADIFSERFVLKQ